MNITSKLFILSLLCSSFAYSAEFNATNTSLKTSSLKKALEKFSFNYFAKYTGDSLGSSYEDGATYNRFDGGRDLNDGSRYDTTGSTQLYQSFKLGYRVSNKLGIAYGVTYQDNVSKNIDYQYSDGTPSPTPRDYGRSFNNHRLSFWTPSIYSNQTVSLSLTSFIERPTTETSKDEEMKYGVGIQPSLTIFSTIPGVSHGFTASVEKNVYNNTEVTDYPSWCKQPGYTCSGIPKLTTKYKTLNLSAGAYFNYQLSDSFTLKNNVDFDWSQYGEDKVFSNNMDNVGNTSISYFATRQITLEGGLNYSLEEASLERTALFASFSLTL